MYKLMNTYGDVEITKDNPEYEELGIEDEIKYLSVGDTLKGKYEYRVTSKEVVIVHSTFTGFTPRWDAVLRRKN